jgi:hypothetical protein
MSQERQFLDTLFQPSFRCLGRILLPMEVGHWLLLSKLGRLCMAGESPGAGDLAMAVYVTTRPHWVAARDVRRAGLWFQTKLMFLARTGDAFERGLATWREYIRWTTERPSFRERSSGGSGASEVLNQPFWLSLLRRAKAQGLTEREAMSQRVKTVLWENVALQEELGAVVWCSEEEMALQAHLLALQKQAKQKPEEQKPIEPKVDEQEQTAMKPEDPSHA